MKRRSAILGLGGLVASGSVAMSTGAFTSVEADRSITIEVADDTEAFLALLPTTEYAKVPENGMFTLDLSPSNPTDAGGLGVNANAETIIKNTFKIENRGTQTVQPTFEGGESDGIEITLSDVSDDLTVTIAPSENADPVDLLLDPGESVSYDVTAFAGEGATPESSIDETITIVAEAIEE